MATRKVPPKAHAKKRAQREAGVVAAIVDLAFHNAYEAAFRATAEINPRGNVRDFHQLLFRTWRACIADREQGAKGSGAL